MSRTKKTTKAPTKKPSNATLYGIIAKNSPALMTMARHLEEVSATEDGVIKTSALLGIIAELDPDLMDVAQSLAGELVTFEEGRRLRHYAVAEAVISKLPLATQQALYATVIERDDLEGPAVTAQANRLLGTVKLTDLNDFSAQKVQPVSGVPTLDV